MKRSPSKILLALSLATLLPLSAHAQNMTLKASDTHPAGYPTVVAVENMGKKLEAASNGSLKLKMFPGGVLGSEKEVVEQTQLGAIQLARISLSLLGPLVPEVDVFNMPFIFRDEAHMRKVIDGPIGDGLLERISTSPAKLVAIAWMDSGSRSVYTKKPVRTPADLKGVKLRAQNNPLAVDTLNAMGGNGIAMSFGEVFTALQTGVIDGAENNAPSLLTSNQYTTGAKYFAQTHHQIIPEVLVMSKASWNKLTDANKVLLKKVAREAQMEQRVLWDKTVAEADAKLKAAGVEFIPVDQKQFAQATAPVRAKYGAQFSKLMEQIEGVQ